MAFLPAGDLGYLEYTAPGAREPGQPAFDLDHSAAEAHEGAPLLDQLNDVFGRFMQEPRCRCQVCEPEFGDASREVA
jgi:hypothetical protein